MKRFAIVGLLFLGILFGGGKAALADSYSNAILDVPGASITVAWGINRSGEVSGYFQRGTGWHGFVYQGGVVTVIDDPSATGDTYAYGINDAGDVVGSYQDGTGFHGFVYKRGVFTTVDVPGAISTSPFGINRGGQIVGQFYDGTAIHGFLYTDGAVTTIDAPGVSNTWPPFGYRITGAVGINDGGEVVGYYCDVTGSHGFLLNKKGAFTAIDDPNGVGGALGGAGGTAAYGINSGGDVAGTFVDGTGNHGFVYSKGVFTTMDVPGATSTGPGNIGTDVLGISFRGEVVGLFTLNGVSHGFLATPTSGWLRPVVESGKVFQIHTPK